MSSNLVHTLAFGLLVWSFKKTQKTSLRSDSTVCAEERKGEEGSLLSLRNGDQFCVFEFLDFVEHWFRDLTIFLTYVQRILRVMNIISKFVTSGTS